MCVKCPKISKKVLFAPCRCSNSSLQVKLTEFDSIWLQYFPIKLIIYCFSRIIQNCRKYLIWHHMTSVLALSHHGFFRQCFSDFRCVNYSDFLCTSWSELRAVSFQISASSRYLVSWDLGPWPGVRLLYGGLAFYRCPWRFQVPTCH